MDGVKKDGISLDSNINFTNNRKNPSSRAILLSKFNFLLENKMYNAVNMGVLLLDRSLTNPKNLIFYS